MKNKVFLLNVALAAIMLVFVSCGGKNPCTYEKNRDCFCDVNPSDPRCTIPPVDDCTFEEDPVCYCANNPADPNCFNSNLPDSIKLGSNFYIIQMDDVSTLGLGYKVVVHQMMRFYDVWPAGQTLAFVERLGINAWDEAAGWLSCNVANGSHLDPPQNFNEGWNGGAIVTTVEDFEVVPDLSPIMDGGYYLHFAIKSPTNQPDAGHTIGIWSEGEAINYFYGPQANCPTGQTWGGNYLHDGEWHHFEISVDELISKGFIWTGPITGDIRDDGKHHRYLLSFMSAPHVLGQEINIDAMFFYKKP